MLSHELLFVCFWQQAFVGLNATLCGKASDAYGPIHVQGVDKQYSHQEENNLTLK